MAISYTVRDFPNLPVSGQLFYAGGQAFEGGFTTGSTRIMSPEPGGRAVLEMKLSLQTREWDRPISSWLMSQTNGVILKVTLTKTPQLAMARRGVTWDNDQLWDNDQPWLGEPVALAGASSLEGSTGLVVDLTGFPTEVLQIGHVIGHGSSAYLIDDIVYDGNDAAIVTNPPLRRNVAVNDPISFRPTFLGTIANGNEFRAMYEAEKNGHIDLGRILLSEVIL